MEGMKYKIGDVARILGISTDLLRYYEKKGVVRPVKDKANDYRYYEAWDINFLMDCLWTVSYTHLVKGSFFLFLFRRGCAPIGRPIGAMGTS